MTIWREEREVQAKLRKIAKEGTSIFKAVKIWFRKITIVKEQWNCNQETQQLVKRTGKGESALPNFVKNWQRKKEPTK